MAVLLRRVLGLCGCVRAHITLASFDPHSVCRHLLTCEGGVRQRQQVAICQWITPLAAVRRYQYRIQSLHHNTLHTSLKETAFRTPKGYMLSLPMQLIRA